MPINETLNAMLQNAVVPIVWIVISWLLGKFLDHITPDAKSIISYIKKALVYAYLYVFPLSVIIYLMIWAPFDKIFVLNIFIYIGGIMFNFTLDLIKDYNKMVRQLITEAQLVKNAHTSVINEINTHHERMNGHERHLENLYEIKKEKKNKKKPKTA